jgi:hypothetical protein
VIAFAKMRFLLNDYANQWAVCSGALIGQLSEKNHVVSLGLERMSVPMHLYILYDPRGVTFAKFQL